MWYPKKNPILKNPPKHISVVSFIPKHVWAVRANDSSASVRPINEIIYCTCWSKLFSKFGLEKPSANAFKTKLWIIIIIQIIFLHYYYFRLLFTYVIIYINDFTMLHIFNNMHPSGFLPHGEYIFARQYSFFGTYKHWLDCVFIFIHNFKKKLSFKFRIGFTLRATSPFLFLERGQKERRVVHSVSMSQANVIVSE